MLAYYYGLPSTIIPSGRITRNLPPSSRPVEKLAPKCSAVSLVRFHTAGASQDRGDQGWVTRGGPDAEIVALRPGGSWV